AGDQRVGGLQLQEVDVPQAVLPVLRGAAGLLRLVQVRELLQLRRARRGETRRREGAPVPQPPRLRRQVQDGGARGRGERRRRRDGHTRGGAQHRVRVQQVGVPEAVLRVLQRRHRLLGQV
ncbi:unnamed protein product, partial [Scytosiphon promiscuus]